MSSADQFSDRLLEIQLAAEALAARAERRLIGMVTHKVRTPLATIKMNLGPLLAAAEEEQDRARLERIGRAAQRLQDLMADLDREDGAWSPVAPLSVGKLNAGEILEDVIAGLRDACDAREISLRLDCDASAEIYGDASLMRLALVNLLGEAIRRAPRASSIHLSCDSAERRTDIRVAYQRSDDAGTPKDAARGVEFRLYLAGAVAEAQGGALYIDASQRGETRLTLSLPTTDRGVA